MKPFWATEPLSEEQRTLLEACRRAHATTAQRNNASTGAVVNSANASRNYPQAIASALLTLGEVHAPVPKAMALLQREDRVAFVGRLLEKGFKVPGWGNAFFKDSIDPEWQHAADLVRVYYPDLHDCIESITHALHAGGKVIHPNAACFTAAVALAVGLPADASIYLVIAGRLPVWSGIFLSTINPQLTT